MSALWSTLVDKGKAPGMVSRGLSAASPAALGYLGDRGRRQWDDQGFQLELSSDGGRAVASCRQAKPPLLTEADLQAKFRAVRIQLLEPTETLNGLREAEAWRREPILVQFRIVECDDTATSVCSKCSEVRLRTRTDTGGTICLLQTHPTNALCSITHAWARRT
jgi:hypothetical protein